jgi:hypothetical protein
MQGHPQAGNMVPAFTEPIMYHHAEAVVLGPTLATQQLDDIMMSTANALDRKTVLAGIASHVTFTISPTLTTLFYATDMEQAELYIHVHARSYITSCLTKLGWEADSNDSSRMPPLSPSTVKEMATSPGPLDSAALDITVKQFGFEYRT